MADNFRVIFVGFADGTDSYSASVALAEKLKTNPRKVTSFFNGNSLFAPTNKDKALKQTKLLSNLGINSKLQAHSNTNQTTLDSQRDQRIFDALDYITSSLIRLEEKLEEIEQRLPDVELSIPNEDIDDWHDTNLTLDEAMTETSTKKHNIALYFILAGAAALLVLLGLYLTLPDLFPF